MEEVVYRLDTGGGPWLEETAVELEEDGTSLVEEEHGSPEVKTAKLGCL